MSDRRAHLRPRPYVLTGGRTSPAIPVDGNTIVRIASEPPEAFKIGALSHLLHRQALIDFCQEPRTVDSVAEHFDLPLQVAKILVADLLVVKILEIQPGKHDRSDIQLLGRVLEGLSR